MKERLINHQQKPRPFGMKTRRLNAVTRILMVLFAMMLIPQGTWAQVDYYMYDTSTGSFTKMTADAGSYTTITDGGISGTSLIAGKTYVVSGNEPFTGRIFLSSSGTVDIILCDGATLDAALGVDVPAGATLNIYGQEKGTGILNAQACTFNTDNGSGTGDFYGAAIGGSYDTNSASTNYPSITTNCGTINIHGGQITANSSGIDNAAGIGGCGGVGPVNLNIYGGKVIATGGKYGAGIGGGGINGDFISSFVVSSNGGTVSIYGGEVIATGGAGDDANKVSMGIGKGSVNKTVASGPLDGSLTINVDVICYGGNAANPMADPTNADKSYGTTGNVTRYQYMETDRSYGLSIGNKTVTASIASNVFDTPTSATISFFPNTNTLKLDGAMYKYDISSSLDNLTVEFNGVNTIGGSSGSDYNRIRSTNNNAPITLKASSAGSTLSISNTTGHAVIDGFSSINLDGIYVSSAVPIHYNATNKRYEDRSNNAVFNNFTLTTTPTYMLWLGSNDAGYVQATQGAVSNASVITAGTVQFASTTNTLSLSDATIKGDIESGLGDLTIDLSGSSSLDYSSASGAAAPIVSTNSGTLNFETANATSSLTFKGDDSANTFSGFTSVTCANNLGVGRNPLNQVVIKVPDTCYDLWIGSVQVTSDNKDDIRIAKQDSILSGSVVKYDPTTRTLTLNNATLNVGVHSNLDDLTIHLIGTNIINNSSKDAAVWSYNTSATLTFECETSAVAAATLNMSSKQYSHSVIQGFNSVIYATGANAAYLKSPHNSSWNYDHPALYGFKGKKRMIDGTFTDMDTNLTEATITSAVKYQLWVNSTQVTSDNYGDVLGDNKNTVFFSPDSHLLILTDASFDGAIISGLDDLTIEFNGSNSLGNSGGYILSSDPNAKLTLKATTPTSTLDLQHTVSRAVLEGFKSIDFDGVYYTNSGVTYDETNREMKGRYGLAQSLSIAAVVNYDLWVGSTQVTSTNATNVLKSDATNDGKVQYDATNQILTLNGAQLSDLIETSMTNLTIHIQGNCAISSYHNCIKQKADAGTLTFTKASGGKLVLSTNGSTVIRGFSTLTGIPLITKTPYEIPADGYPRLKDKLSSDTSCVSYAIVEANQTYPVWVGIQQVTSDNNVGFASGSGTISYTPDTKTLTLNGATITANGVKSTLGYGIVTGDNLKVKLTGSNSITCSNAGDYAFKSYNTTGAAAPTITFATDTSDPGTLTLNVKTDGNLFSNVTPVYDNDLNRYEDGNDGTYYVTRIAPLINYDLWVQGTRVTSANASDIGDKNNYNIDISFDPVSSTLYYKSNGGGGSAQSVTSGLPNLIIKIGSPDTSSGDYTKNNIGIIKFGAPTGETIAATSGTLTLSKEDGVTGVQQFNIVGYSGEPSLIQGFDDVDYGDFAILAEGATYNTQTKQLEYLKPDGSGNYIGLDNTTTFVTPQDLSSYYVANIANQDYAGSGLNAAITVKETETATIALVENRDYTVSYTLSGATATPKDANTYNVIINGKGRYVGSITNKTFTINPIAVGLSWSGTSFTFDGDAHKPTATATGLIGSDVCNVTVTGEQTNASATAYTATATALDNNNYKLPTTGLTQDFTISPCSLAYANIAVIPAETYSGSEIKPTPEVKITLGTSTSETTLSAETDFEYTYANNKNAAKASDNLPPTVTITGKGNYNGTRVVKFTIDPLTATLAWSNTTLTYNGSPQQPTAEVSNLISPDVCTVTVTGAQTNAGDYTATAISLSNTNYQLPTTGLTQDFTIKDRTANITFNAGQTYKTFYSAGENLLVPNDVKAYVVTMVSGNTVNLTQISYIHSNVPVLLESSSGATTVKDPSETLPSTNLLKYASTAVSTDGNQYVLYSGEFVKATGTIPADRVYLAYSSPVRRLTIERNNSATAIEAVSDEDADDEQWYDMQGRKINKPTKAGLYIKNGKKVVVNNK